MPFPPIKEELILWIEKLNDPHTLAALKELKDSSAPASVVEESESLYGAWKVERTAEEIIVEVRANRSKSREIEEIG